jgi:hypothetical protein
MTSRDLSLGGAPTHLRQGDSVLEHLDSPSAHRCLRGDFIKSPTSARKNPLQIEVSFNSRGSNMPKTQWLHYGGNPLAPLRRKPTGSYVPEGDTRPHGPPPSQQK